MINFFIGWDKAGGLLACAELHGTWTTAHYTAKVLDNNKTPVSVIRRLLGQKVSKLHLIEAFGKSVLPEPYYQAACHVTDNISHFDHNTRDLGDVTDMQHFTDLARAELAKPSK